MFNCTFILGDRWCDGHGCTSEYHIVTSHSAETIVKAYKDFCDTYGFEYLREVGNEYECFGGIPEKITNKLFDLGILTDKSRIIRYDESGEKYKNDKTDFYKNWDFKHDGCYEFDDCLDDFIEIFFNIITFMIPDFTYKVRDLEEETIEVLDGAGYGLVSYP